jgi:hypothetical protein
MKINKLALLLLPVLALTSCGGKTLSEEETKQLVASFAANNEEVVEEVRGYTLKSETIMTNTLTTENSKVSNSLKNTATAKFDIENYAYYVKQSSEIKNDLTPEENVNISFEEWLYFEEETSNFVYAIDGDINGEEIKGYVKIPANKDLFYEVFDETLSSDVEMLQPGDLTNEEGLEEILSFFELAKEDANISLVVKSKGEGHINVHVENKNSVENEVFKRSQETEIEIEFNNYLFSRNSVRFSSVEEDFLLKTKTEETISAKASVSTKCSYKYPDLSKFSQLA